MAKDFVDMDLSSLSEHEIAGMQYVYTHGRVTVKELAEHLNRSVRVSRDALKSLVNKEMLVWHGSNQNDPAQFYSLKDKRG